MAAHLILSEWLIKKSDIARVQHVNFPVANPFDNRNREWTRKILVRVGAELMKPCLVQIDSLKPLVFIAPFFF